MFLYTHTQAWKSLWLGSILLRYNAREGSKDLHHVKGFESWGRIAQKHPEDRLCTLIVHRRRICRAPVESGPCMLAVHVCVCICTRVCCVVREGAIYRQTGREKKGKKLKSDWLSSLQEAFIEQRVRSL